jgi:hypothetical protein
VSITTPQGEAAREAVAAEVTHLESSIPELLSDGPKTAQALMADCSTFAQSAVRTAIWNLLNAGTITAHHDGHLVFTVANSAGSVEAKLVAAEARLRRLGDLHDQGRIQLMSWDSDADDRRGAFVRDHGSDLDKLFD